MKDTSSLLSHQLKIARLQCKAWLAYITFDNAKFGNTLSSELRNSLNLVSSMRQQRRLNQQHEIAVFSCETFQQAIRNKSRKPGYEQCFSIRH
jgi:hypothetical protein